MSSSYLRPLRVSGLLALLLAAASLYGPADVSARPLAPAPGMYIGIGSHHLHLNCTGDGGPTVILESGLGGNSLDWSRVQPLVARHSRVCSYDRAGYGWSDAAREPRTARQIASELHRLLVYGSVPPPYILVGHSFGGLVVRLFASQHPDETAGIVLVDSSHEEQFERFEAAGIKTPLLPTGGKFYIFNHSQIPEGLPEKIRPVAQELALQSSAVLSLYGELRLMRRSTRQVRASKPLPEVPVVVITRSSDDDEEITEAGRVWALWLKMQVELASQSRLGVLIMADTKDHYVHLRQPRLVAGIIRSLVERHRARH